MKPQIFIFMLFISSLSAQKNTEILRVDKNDGFYHNLNLEIGYSTGNSNKFEVDGGYRLDYVSGLLHSFLVGNIEFQESMDKKVDDNAFIHARAMYEFINKLNAEFFVQKEYDEFINLQDRDLIGISFRYNPLKYRFGADSTGLLDINFATGAMYEYEYYKNTNSIHETQLFRSTSYFSLKLFFDKKTNFSTVVYFQPEFEYIHNYRILNENRISFAIYDNFKIYINTSYRFDNEPEPDVMNYDFKLTNGFIINF